MLRILNLNSRLFICIFLPTIVTSIFICLIFFYICNYHILVITSAYIYEINSPLKGVVVFQTLSWYQETIQINIPFTILFLFPWLSNPPSLFSPSIPSHPHGYNQTILFQLPPMEKPIASSFRESRTNQLCGWNYRNPTSFLP